MQFQYINGDTVDPLNVDSILQLQDSHDRTTARVVPNGTGKVWQEFQEWVNAGNEPLPTDEPPLEQARTAATENINRAARDARERYTTRGKEMVYAEQKAEVVKWLEAGGGAVEGEYPLAAQRAEKYNSTTITILQEWLDIINFWSGKNLMIEGATDDGKINITAATTSEEVEAAVAKAVVELDGI